MAKEYRLIQARARLASDQGTIASLRSTVILHSMRNNGEYPPSPEALRRLYEANTGRSLAFACPGNDFTYDAATGKIELVIEEAERC
jgi:hypothetical protein